MARPKKEDLHPHRDKFGSIEMMSAVGIPTKDIAQLHGMTPQTLHNHYQEQLDIGASKANAAVGGKIYKAAMRGEAWAAKIWAAKRLGWRDTPQAVELTGKDGGAIETETKVVADDTLNQFIDEFRRLKTGSISET